MSLMLLTLWLKICDLHSSLIAITEYAPFHLGIIGKVQRGLDVLIMVVRSDTIFDSIIRFFLTRFSFGTKY